MADTDRAPPNDVKTANVLRYNVRWMDNVFNSRSTTEALLSPQREAGNLTLNDYNASLDFLSGYHRHYPVLGVLMAITLVFPFRNPKWSQLKTHAVNVTAGLGGFTFGRLAVISAHYNYLCTIENPDGFSKAMENVQSKLGAPKAGLVIARTYQPALPDDAYPNQTPDDSLQLMLPSSNSESSPSKPGLTDKERSKWEQIRAANNRTVHSSSWDTLRQKHERENVKHRSEMRSWDDDGGEKVDADKYATSNLDGRYSDRSGSTN